MLLGPPLTILGAISARKLRAFQKYHIFHAYILSRVLNYGRLRCDELA